MANSFRIDQDFPIDPDVRCVFVDLGSYNVKYVKIGLDRDGIRKEFCAVVARPQPMLGGMMGMDFRDCWVGDDIWDQKYLHRYKRPIETDSEPINWNDIEKLLHHTFYNTLRVQPEENIFMVSDIPDAKVPDPTRENNGHRYYSLINKKEKLTSIMFETFNCWGLSVVDPAVSAIHLSGSPTGLVLDIGNRQARAIPIFESVPIHHAKVVLHDPNEVNRKSISGDLISDVFINLLTKSEKYSENEVLKYYTQNRDFFHRSQLVKMKNDSCYLTTDLGKINSFKRGGYTIEKLVKKKQQEGGEEDLKECFYNEFNPNRNQEEIKRTIMLGDERFLAPEILFNPSLIGFELPGIHQIIQLAIQKCPEEIQHLMYSNIVCVGGTTLMKNFKERLTIEMKNLLPTTKMNIMTFPENGTGSSIDGMRLLEQDPQHKFISMERYNEYGPTVVHRMCPYTTTKNDDHHLSEMKWIHSNICIDDDLEERVDYLLGAEDNEEGFKISMVENCSVFVKFKYLLML